ncbi:MAG: hemolysin family protein [Planctomycetes bacterium]|nr:hemolysin family protein [Planctomycetota bacterium]
MTADGLFWLACAGLLATVLSATGAKVLHEFSVSGLEEYCRRRNRRELFGVILDHSEDAALAAESLQTLGAVLTVLAGGFWMLEERTLTPGTLAGAAAIGALVLLAVTSWIPWAVAEVWSAPFLYHTWRVWRALMFVLWPLTVGVSVFRNLLHRLSGEPEEEWDEEEEFEEEVRAIVTAATREGHLEEDAREMIESVIQLADSDVSDIMTPRSAVDALEANLGWREMLKFVISAGRTRLPVYEERLDNVLGVLYVKDLMPELARPRSKRRAFRELVRPAWFVPATRPVNEMLRDFLRTRNHLAIVLDEYESVAGIVTIEDVLEEIVGEIVDESDKDEPSDIIPIDDSTAEAVGRTHLADLNELFGFDFPEPEDYDTIGGFLMHHLGEIPKPGEHIQWNGLRITVLESTRRRIDRVRIERQPYTRSESA